MESFFSTLKTERVNRRVYRARDEARADVFDYIERFYNPHRRHSTLNFLSPVQFDHRLRASEPVRENGGRPRSGCLRFRYIPEPSTNSLCLLSHRCRN